MAETESVQKLQAGQNVDQLHGGCVDSSYDELDHSSDDITSRWLLSL